MAKCSRPGRIVLLTGLCLYAAGIAPVRADGLRAGEYGVQVRIDLPNLDGITPTVTSRVCVTGADGAPTQGLKVLSANNPLTACPASDVRADSGELRFEIRCPGGNAARAQARYELGEAAFRGRITMKMGGKNMTMTETQVGRWTGPCGRGNAPTH